MPSDRILPSLHAYLLRMQGEKLAFDFHLRMLNVSTVCLLRIDGKSDESQVLLARLAQLNTSEEDKVSPRLVNSPEGRN